MTWEDPTGQAYLSGGSSAASGGGSSSAGLFGGSSTASGGGSSSAGLFGSSSAASGGGSSSAGLFGSSSAASGGGSLFGGSSAASDGGGLFGNSSSALDYENGMFYEGISDQNDVHGGREFIEKIYHSTLTESVLDRFWLKSMRGFRAFLMALENNKNVKELRFYRKNIDPEKGKIIGNMLCKNHSLKSLILSDSDTIKDASVTPIFEAMKMNTSITHLEISRAKISKYGKLAGDMLAENQMLKQLNLNYTELHYSTMEAFTNGFKLNRSLTHLDLSHNNLGFAVRLLFAALRENKTLQCLDLSYCCLDPKSGHEMAEMLKVNTTLKTLSIHDNLIGSDPEKNIFTGEVIENASFAIAKALEVNCTLTDLNLSCCRFKGEGAKAIAKSLAVNTSIEKFYFGSNYDLGDDVALVFAEIIKQNKSLIILDFYNCGFKEIGCKAIGESLGGNTSLEQLILTNNEVSNLGACAIAESLKSRNVSLKCLGLSGCKIGEQGANALGEMLIINKSLKALNLSGNSRYIVRSLVDVLKANNTLLDLKIQKIESYDILCDENNGDNSLVDLLESLKVNVGIEAIDLSWNRLDKEKVAEMLRVNQRITCFSASHSSLVSSSSETPFAGLEVNTTLCDLDVGYGNSDQSKAILLRNRKLAWKCYLACLNRKILQAHIPPDLENLIREYLKVDNLEGCSWAWIRGYHNI